ncbi:MAG: hypothetical protein HY717_14495 [Planctomycetes bacterium]|nr:hypothetical protein [Planctomycetota bacterium]
MNSNLIRLEGVYDYYCQFGGPLGFGHDFRPEPPARLAEAVKLIQQFKELRRLLVEDYYPLFGDYVTDNEKWDGWQFHDPKTNEGFFLVFRLPQSPYSEALVKLHGLDPGKEYTLSADQGTGLQPTAMGQALLTGITVRLTKPRSALLVRYR